MVSTSNRKKRTLIACVKSGRNCKLASWRPTVLLTINREAGKRPLLHFKMRACVHLAHIGSVHCNIWTAVLVVGLELAAFVGISCLSCYSQDCVSLIPIFANLISWNINFVNPHQLEQYCCFVQNGDAGCLQASSLRQVQAVQKGKSKTTSYQTEHSCLQILISNLDRPAPNMTHLLLGFDCEHSVERSYLNPVRTHR